MADPASRPQRLEEWLRASSLALRDACGSDEARLEVETLWAHVLGCTRGQLALRRDRLPTVAEITRFQALFARRLAGEPVAYLEGRRGFWGLELAVDPRVLIPRPDSELLVERALALLAPEAAARVLDLGTGSGALLLAVLQERAAACGLGIDRSRGALEVARANAREFGLQARTAWLEASWLEALAPACADLILCNPPYIVPGEEMGPGVAEWEPASALFVSAEDPVAPYRAVLHRAATVLRADGALLFEVGAGRAEAVAALCAEQGWQQVERRRDLGGIERLVEARGRPRR